MFLSISEQHDYNKNIFIYINNQFMPFLPVLNVHLWYQFDVQKKGSEQKNGEHLRIRSEKCLKNINAKVCKKINKKSNRAL